jgi:hypothetical protein
MELNGEQLPIVLAAGMELTSVQQLQVPLHRIQVPPNCSIGETAKSLRISLGGRGIARPISSNASRLLIQRRPDGRARGRADGAEFSLKRDLS